MRPFVFFASAPLVLALSVLAWRLDRASSTESIKDGTNSPAPVSASICPWREPESDLKEIFPDATGYESETQILSGHRLEVQKRLGRVPTADENALHLYRVFRETTQIGSVLTRRVKGEFGAIELVLFLDMNQRVRDWKIQRIREPETIARALLDPAFRRSFQGKTADSAWRLGEDVPEVTDGARVSAKALLDGARALSVLAVVADESATLAAARHH